MKLIFVNRYFHPDISATSQLLTDLALHQAAMSWEVHVVTSRQLYDDPAASLPPEEQHCGVSIHRVRTTCFGRADLAGRALDYASFYLAAGRALSRIACAGDVIVAKTDPPLISVVAARVARRRGAHLVNWLQDLFPEVAERLGVRVPFAGALRRLRTRSLRQAVVNVAVGELMAARVSALAGAASRVEVIENWSDGSAIRPLDRNRNPLRAAWGLAQRFVVGYSGNMGRAHEFHTILAACELLRDDTRIAFLFVGAGRQRGWIEDEARRRQLPNVTLQPYQPREALARSLCVADAHLVALQPNIEGLIVPSKFYGIAAAGRPALFVGDPDGEIARTIRREGCGSVIRTGDAAGLAAAIRALADHPAEAERMGAAARSAFERRFEARSALDRWDRILRAAAASAAHA